MATPRYLSATDGFIPQATGQAIAYVRDPQRFKLNQYVQLITAPKPVVVYAFLDPDQPVRVENDQMFAWEDGNPRPLPSNNTGNFVWNEVRCFRRDYGWSIGEQALEAAEGWNPQMFFNATILSQAMTNRTIRFLSLSENTANWGANTADANTLNGGAGKFNTASDVPGPNFLAIKKAIQQAILQIVLNTNASVLPSEMMSVWSPGLAMASSETAEIHNYLAKSVHAYPVLEGQKLELNLYGLPPFLYGLKTIVEDSPKVTSNQTSAGTRAVSPARAFAKSDTSLLIVSRVGGLEGNYGSPSYSTLQRYFYKYDLAVEAFDDPLNKRVQSHVVDQFKEVLPAPQAGFLITNTL